MNSNQCCFLFSIMIYLFLLFTIVATRSRASSIITASFNGNATDRLALLSFKSMITHDPYGVLSSWNTSFHFCDWEGVTCGKRHRRVIVLNLSSRGLVGSLSPHVGNLSFLRALQLRNNTFQGNIPRELGRLFRLQSLLLGFNNFSGVIPTNLSRCSNLYKLGLTYNSLVGDIPMEVSFLKKLIHLDINFNYLTGSIPPSIGNLTSLVLLSVAGNPFGGSIPETLGELKMLKELHLGGCNLTGTIPPSIYNLSLLANLSLAENQLGGNLPPSLGEMLPKLEDLQIRNNQLTGSLPLSLSNCSNLKYLELGSNKFNGMLKIDFSRLTNIKNLVMHDNNLGSGGPDEMNFFYSMANCSKLNLFHLGGNKFKGVLPNSIGNLSNQLLVLSLEFNQLHGNLPSSVGNLVGLSNLFLNDNNFTGKIPQTIGKLQNLQRLKLSSNQFTGSIPNSTGNITLLLELYLSSNMVKGRIPSSLGFCQNLLLLDLSHNKLIGNIPNQLFQLSSLSISLDLSQNNLSGSLPSEVGKLRNLNKLDLSDNDLSGIIPSGLGGCVSLGSLYLQGNLFQGKIPSSLTSLRGIANLDLSRNNLSGNIPQFLEQFALEYLNLSSNDFEGEVPMKGVFANASAILIFGNSRLCGGLHELGLPKCKEKKVPERLSHLVVIVVSVICAILVVCISSFFVFSSHKKKKAQQSESPLKDNFFQVSYGELLRATDGFSEANLIGGGGFGSIYKGILDSRTVAIKVLHLQNHGAYKSFLAECEAWRSIRHRNLLRIITSCSSIDFQGNDFKALVYEFMPNGSLDGWLHSSPRVQRLSLLQRITLLLDVANALDYLHNRCQTTIVHCDLKPSNILINGEMISHVGDFGLAKFLQADASNTSSVGIRGTIGYTAPEYGLGNEMTTNGDVYSFGILLLETMTGKRPTDNMFKEGLDLHKLASMALPDHVTDVVDKDILNFDENEEICAEVIQNSMHNEKEIEELLVSVIQIGVACSVESPQDRMKIEEVIYELQHIKDALKSSRTSQISHA